MRKSRYTDQQIALALRQAEAGAPVAEICRKYGISEQTFYRWKKKFGQMAPGGRARDWAAPRGITPSCVDPRFTSKSRVNDGEGLPAPLRTTPGAPLS
jgi:hypothetical protein